MKKLHVLIFIAVFGLWACEKKTASEEVGEAVEAVGEEAGEALEEAGDSIKDGAEKAKETVKGE